MTWKLLPKDKLREQYDIVVPDADLIHTRYQNDSEQTVAELGGYLNIPYDTGGVRHTLDLFVPESDQLSPILVFIHGGYWHHNSKDARRFPASLYVNEDIAWVPINYRQVPSVKIEDIIHDVRTAVAWLYNNADKYKCDRSRIYVCGNSAGGHLVGMLVTTDWQKNYDLPDNVIKGGCAISGLFELEPLLYTQPNEWLKMDRAQAILNSPMQYAPDQKCKMILSWGSKETDEFRRQSLEYAEFLLKNDVSVRYFELDGENHYSIIGKLADPNNCLFDAIIKLIKHGQGDSH